MALATTCPQCKTSFKVVPDQLKLRRGLVRCGVCQHVFSGIDFLRYVDERPPAPAPLPDDDEAFDAGPDAPFAPDGENLDTAFFEPASGDVGSGTPPAGPGWPPESIQRRARSPDGGDALDGTDEADPGALDGDAPDASPAPAGSDWPDGADDPAGEPAHGHDVDRVDDAGDAGPDGTRALEGDFGVDPAGQAVAPGAADDVHGQRRDDALDGVRDEGGNGEVEHYDITAARGWPHEDAQLQDDAATAPDDDAPAAGDASHPAGDGAPAGVAAAAASGLAAVARPHAGADGEKDAIDFFAPQRRVRGFSSRTAPLQWLAACLLGVVLVAQLLIGARHWIAARAPDLEPLLSAAAGAIGLTVDPPRDLDALTIESFELQAGGVDKLFALVAHLRNRADHVVHWPAMELALTDSAGTLLVRKVLMPADYLGTGGKSPLPAGIGPLAEVPVRVALEAPGLSPSGYTVNIFYP